MRYFFSSISQVLRLAVVVSVFQASCSAPSSELDANSQQGTRCQSSPTAQQQLPRDFLAARTAGFYTTGFVSALARVMQRSSEFNPGDSSYNAYLAKAAVYQLQARGLLQPSNDPSVFVPTNDAQWSEVSTRAIASTQDYKFKGFAQRADTMSEVQRVVSSTSFSTVLNETLNQANIHDYEQTRLIHHGHVWVPLMTALNYALLADGKTTVMAALTSTEGLHKSSLPEGSPISRAMDLLAADGLVNGTEPSADRFSATTLGLDGLPKLARWSGLLASYDTLGDGDRILTLIMQPGNGVSVDNRHLNIASSGAGLPRFVEDFVIPTLRKINESEGLKTIIGVGTGSGQLEKLLSDSRHFLDADLFGSDLNADDGGGRNSLQVAKEALEGIVRANRIFAADVSQPEDLFTKVRAIYAAEGLDRTAIEDKLAHGVVTSGFITHEPREFTPDNVIAMLNGYADNVPHFVMLEIPLVDAAIHAQQAYAHFGVEIATFHLASGQTIRSLPEWKALIAHSNYRIDDADTKGFNNLLDPATNTYSIPSYVGLHLVRR